MMSRLVRSIESLGDGLEKVHLLFLSKQALLPLLLHCFLKKKSDYSILEVLSQALIDLWQSSKFHFKRELLVCFQCLLILSDKRIFKQSQILAKVCTEIIRDVTDISDFLEDYNTLLCPQIFHLLCNFRNSDVNSPAFHFVLKSCSLAKTAMRNNSNQLRSKSLLSKNAAFAKSHLSRYKYVHETRKLINQWMHSPMSLKGMYKELSKDSNLNSRLTNAIDLRCVSKSSLEKSPFAVLKKTFPSFNQYAQSISSSDFDLNRDHDRFQLGELDVRIAIGQIRSFQSLLPVPSQSSFIQLDTRQFVNSIWVIFIKCCSNTKEPSLQDIEKMIEFLLELSSICLLMSYSEFFEVCQTILIQIFDVFQDAVQELQLKGMTAFPVEDGFEIVDVTQSSHSLPAFNSLCQRLKAIIKTFALLSLEKQFEQPFVRSINFSSPHDFKSIQKHISSYELHACELFLVSGTRFTDRVSLCCFLFKDALLLASYADPLLPETAKALYRFELCWELKSIRVHRPPHKLQLRHTDGQSLVLHGPESVIRSWSTILRTLHIDAGDIL